MINAHTYKNGVSSSHLQPKRVLYLDHTAKIGGGEIAILNLARAIDHTRFTPIFVLASTGPLVERLRSFGFETHVLELNSGVSDVRKDTLGVRSLLKLGDGVAFFSYTLKLAKLMKDLDVDLVHTNSLKSDIYGALAARMAGLPVVWHVRDSIDSAYLPSSVAALFRQMARFLPNYVVANSISTLDKLNLNRNQRAAVVYSGVDPKALAEDHVRFGRREVLDDGKASRASATVTMVGRIAEWKGQHIFLRAASIVLEKHRDVVFQVVGAPLFGEEEYEQSLFKLSQELGIDNSVEFLGFREDVPQIVGSCDILVHASIIGEPFGQVVVEGMALGKPVVATNGGALPEIVVQGETGLLVGMGNVEEMADAIEQLLANRPKAYEMGQRGRKRVLDHFTTDRSAARIHQVYEQILVGAAKVTNTTDVTVEAAKP